MAKTTGERKQTEKAELVSFKIAKEIYQQIEKYAKTQRDEAGFELSPSQAARRLVIEALKSHKK